jgi:CubicO group peptidase (beta-lactamase class C family)
MSVPRCALLLALAACAVDPGPPIPKTVCPSAVSADGAAVEDLCALLEPLREQHELPALAAAVWIGGELVAEGAVGVRKVGADARVTTSDKWHLGSDTKAMTATLAGKLVEDGKLSFDAPVSLLFGGEEVHPAYQTVTLRQLLMHRSGTARMPSAALRRLMSDDERSFETREAVALAVLKRAPEKPVGAFLYSNTGYLIAGAALERAADAEWEVLLRRELFEPLQMASCGFGAPATLGTVDEPWGHQDDGRFIPIAPGGGDDVPPAMGPAGAVHCALRDWGKFLTVHLKAARGEPTLLSAATMAELQTAPADGNYALGWGVGKAADGSKVLTHSGSNGMFIVTAWIVTGRNAIVVTASNAGLGKASERASRRAFEQLIVRDYANRQRAAVE